MGELIIPKPAVGAGVAALEAALPAHYDVELVSSDLPGLANGHRTYPTLFVRMTRVGPSGMLNMVTDRARLLVECYADKDSDTDCEQFANTCRALLRAVDTRTRFAGAYIRRWQNDTGPVPYPDPSVPSHERWQFQGDLLVSTN
ncbi:hypothetical protein [Mycolicibacterium fortuitum]|uniref:hypothetical protein n=1 Tax=Mycolicibacterium fortuitum TaxID=1766 RepID=UPI00262D8D7F|nr:hypothetical protein [Mycolicibacterium fortuitum]